MAWKFDKPLVSLCCDEQNAAAKALWEKESLGGIKEDNNRLPRPVVYLLGLTIITAFLVTAPLWGQRPTAAIYEDYVAKLNDPEIAKLSTDAEKIARIQEMVVPGNEWQALQERHPIDMDDLLLIKDKIVELKKNADIDLEEYTIVGDQVVEANFEGNCKNADCSERVRKQPWWDKGYTIDVFYVIYFCIAVVIAVKRLPDYSFQPRHAGH